MIKAYRIKRRLPDIIVCLVIFILLTTSIILSIYARSGYMFEGEYIYSGSTSSGYKEVYRLIAEYDKKQNAMLVKLEYITNYDNSDGADSDTISINNSYECTDNIIVKLDEMDKSVYTIYSSEGILSSIISSSEMVSVKDYGSRITYNDKVISFGDDGVILTTVPTYTLSTRGSSCFLHKNGFLTEVTVHIVRITLTSIAALLMGLYILFRVHTLEQLYSKIAIGVCAVVVAAMFVSTDYSVNGTYTAITVNGDTYIQNYLVINPLKDGQYLVATSTDTSIGTYAIFEKEGRRIVNSRDDNVFIKKFKNGVLLSDGLAEMYYLGGEDFAVNKAVPVVLVIPFIIAVLDFIYKFKKDGGDDSLIIPFGYYIIKDILYINEEFADMEEYYRDNMTGRHIEFLDDKFVLPSESVKFPEYILEKRCAHLYPLQGRKRMIKITVKGQDCEGVNYFMAYNNKQSILVQRLENMITVVYSLGEI